MSAVVLRFRVMAIVCGVMSLLLWFGYMPGKYLFHLTENNKFLVLIPLVHGYLYMAYLLTALQFSIKAKWPIMRVLWLLLAGTLPVASLVAERRVVKQYS